MNLVPAILTFVSGTYTVTRQAIAGYGTDGRLQPGSASTLTCVASVQPIRGRDLERLPEGLRTSEARVVFTPTALKIQSSAYQPDQIQIDGEAWQVQSLEDWSTLGGYYKAIVIKMGG